MSERSYPALAWGNAQDEVFAFLGDPSSHLVPGPVTRIDTHGAAVFLAGHDVYKVKRAVRFPFMDYSTLDKRRQACEAEVRVNQPHSVGLYLGVVPITRSPGGLAIAGAGEPVEWAVHLRRFDEHKTLDLVAAHSGLSLPRIAEIADAVLAWHARAEAREGVRAVAALENVLEETIAELVAAADVFPKDRTDRLKAAIRASFAANRILMLRRGEQGQVRRCHGDLHLGNIALIDGQPVPFDAIEFDEDIAVTDVLYDLAFLVMDLWERGLHRESNYCFNRYLWGSVDLDRQLEGLAVLPLFLALRAAIRAKIAVLPDAAGKRPARCAAIALPYFEAAEGFVAPAKPRLIAMGGLSGSGKTTLAAALAAFLGRVPGAVHLRSDIERKRRFGVAAMEHLPETAYGAETSQECYASLRRQAEIALRAGQSVIVDAVHAQPDERRAIAEIAAATGVGFTGIWLEAPIGLLAARVAKRKADASDATPDVVRAQARYDLGEIDWARLDASGSIKTLAEQALALIGRTD